MDLPTTGSAQPRPEENESEDYHKGFKIAKHTRAILILGYCSQILAHRHRMQKEV